MVNFVVRHVRKLVPEHTLAAREAPRAALCRSAAPGRPAPFQRAAGPQRRLPAVHRRHHRRVQGATLLHRNLVANVLQMDAWFSPCCTGWATPADHGAALPLYHIFALTLCGLFSTSAACSTC
jgi:long-chain acyl-CoA synthetase